MKTNFTIFLLLITIAANALKIRFTDQNNNWQTNGATPDCTFANSIYYDIDTTLFGKSYKRVRNNFYPSIYYCMGGFDSLIYVSEDTGTGIVYYYYPELDSQEHILYNYSLNIGDTIRYIYGGAYYNVDTVVHVDSIIINGFYYKVLQFAGQGRSYVVLEGIGCLNDPLFTAVNAGGCFEREESLLCFVQDTIVPYFFIPDSPYNFYSCFGYVNSNACALKVQNVISANENITLYPNPANNQITIANNASFEKNCTIIVYDITGRCMYQTIAESGKNQMQINTSNWCDGFYFVYVQNINPMINESISNWKKFCVLHSN